MEDAIFQKNTREDIWNIRHADQKKIEACHSQLYPIFPRLPLASQAASEDIDNAAGTVKAWKSRWVLNDVVFSLKPSEKFKLKPVTNLGT